MKIQILPMVLIYSNTEPDFDIVLCSVTINFKQ